MSHLVAFLHTTARSSRSDRGTSKREQDEDSEDRNKGTKTKEDSGTDTEEEADAEPKESTSTKPETKESSVEEPVSKDDVKTSAGEAEPNSEEPKEEKEASTAAKEVSEKKITPGDSEVKKAEADNPAPDEGAKAEETPKFTKETDIVKMRKIIDSAPTFPEKLMRLLQHECDPDAIFWLPEGDSFGINKPLFEEKVLNKYFRGNKFTSITRNLNRW
jgi:HSF-type DNA-binding